MRYAKKFAYCLLRRDFAELQTFSPCKLQHTLNALSGLAKFLGIYQEFQHLVKAYGLKWNARKSEDLVISRLIKTNGSNDILEWIREVKAKLPKLSVFMRNYFNPALITDLRERVFKAVNEIRRLGD